MRKILAVLIILVLTFSLVACGNKDSKSEIANDGEDEELSGTVVIWSWDVAAKALEEAAEKFNEKYPKVEFEVEDLGTDQVYDKLTTRLASNTGLPDVVTIEAGRVTSFASKFPDGFVDLTDVVEAEDFLPVKIGECKVNDKLVAYPWDGAPCGLFYRLDLFEQAEINPEKIKTWEDFIEAGQKMNDINVKMVPLETSTGTTLYRILLNQLGGDIFDSDGNTIVNSEMSKRAMTLVKKMYDAGITYDNKDWDDLVTASKEGKIATVPTAVWWAGTLQDECKDSNGDWRVMKLPIMEPDLSYSAVNGGSNVMIPKGAENKRAAIEFVKFAMTNKEVQNKSFSKYGLYPSYTPCYEDPVFDEEVEYFGGQQIWKLFNEIGEDIPEPNDTENSSEAYDHLEDVQARILLKGEDVSKTLDELQKTLVSKFDQ